MRRLFQRIEPMSLEEMKKRERPAFTPVPGQDPAKAAYIVTRRSKRSRAWLGYLKREGFRWSSGKMVWVYDQHDDGTLVTLEEAKWVAERVRDMVAGELSFTIGLGFFLEPVPDVQFWARRRLRPRHP